MMNNVEKYLYPIIAAAAILGWLAFFVTIATIANAWETRPSIQPNPFPCPFPFIIDGDTLECAATDSFGQRYEFRVRLWGINTAERGQPGYDEAALLLADMTANQPGFFCGSPPNRPLEEDKRGRVVAQCFMQDGTDVGALLVDSGLAEDCPRYSRGFYEQLEKPGAPNDRERCDP